MLGDPFKAEAVVVDVPAFENTSVVCWQKTMDALEVSGGVVFPTTAGVIADEVAILSIYSTNVSTRCMHGRGITITPAPRGV